MLQTIGKYLLLAKVKDETPSGIQIVSYDNSFEKMVVVLVGSEYPKDTLEVGDTVLVNPKKCLTLRNLKVEGFETSTFLITDDLSAVMLKF